MNKTNLYIILVTLALTSIDVFAKSPTIPSRKSECVILIGKYECPIGEKSELFIPKSELIKLDSLSCNCGYSVNDYEMQMGDCFDCEIIVHSSKIIPSVTKYFKIINTGRKFVFKITTAKGAEKVEYVHSTISVTVDTTYNRAYIIKHPSNQYCFGKMDLKKAEFLKFDTLFVQTNIRKDRNLDVKSFNVEVISHNETKYFPIIGNTLTDEIKTYMLNTKGKINMIITDVIAANPDNSNKQEIEGLVLNFIY